MKRSLLFFIVTIAGLLAHADIPTMPKKITRTSKTVVCTSGKVSGLQPDIKIDAILTEGLNTSELEVVRVSRRNSESEEFKTFTTKKSITTDGSLAEANLNIRAVGRLTGSTDSCFKKGTELHIVQTGRIGGRGKPVILGTIRELPRFVRRAGSSDSCSIPRPMVPRPYNVACSVEQ